MDKAEFIRVAPAYYVAAAIMELENTFGGFTSEAALREAWTVPGDDMEDGTCFLMHGPLLRAAVQALADAGVVELLTDHFAPPLFKTAPTFADYVRGLEADTTTVSYRLNLAPRKREWLLNALRNLNEQYSALKVTKEDLENPDAEWTPLPIERPSGFVDTAIATVDEVKKEIEQSNGYASEHPEERSVVVERLTALSDKLKKAAAISIAYIRANGLSVLKWVTDRFANALIGALAKKAYGALEKLVQFLLGQIF